MKFFVYFIMFVVAVAIGFGFYTAGSPGQERLRRFDEQRVGHLQLIQGSITNFWQGKGRLPATLDELNDPVAFGGLVLTDPSTSAPYEYMIKDEKNVEFELCATFETSNGAQYGGAQVDAPQKTYPTDSYTPTAWEHPVGRMCFDRTIDPDFYPPRKGTTGPVPVSAPY